MHLYFSNKYYLLPQKEKEILVNDAITKIYSHSEDEKRKFVLEISDYKENLGPDLES
jgi:hypothetical protein